MRLKAFSTTSLREATGRKQHGFVRYVALSCFALLLAILMTPCGAMAQMAGYGAISGTVTDSTGAVIKGASVTATLVSQNSATTRTTTGAGDYNITPLTPGEYKLTVTAKGFETYVQENITVNALQTVAVQVKLTVGATQQTITVTEAPPVLETSDAALGAVMDNQMYSSLPLLMGAGGNADQRRATDFAVLMPGVQNAFQSSSTSNMTSASGAVNGGNPSGGTSEIYIDGINLPEADGIGDPRFTWTAFGMDSIDQFQVQTIGYSAQYAGQGVQNYSIKQGGNKWHGSVYEYFRNTVLDAWGPTSKTPMLTGATIPTGGSCTSAALSADTNWCKLGGIKQSNHMNEVGASFGGPLLHNKLFFFYNYGQYRQVAGPKNAAQNMPTLAMMGYADTSGTSLGYADFTGYATATGYSIYDPATQTTYNCSSNACTRSQFKNSGTANQIPGNRLSAASQYINKFMLPYEAGVNQSAYISNIVTGYKSGLSNWYQSGRIDYNMSDKNQISLIVAFGRQANTGSNASGAANQLGPPFNTSQDYAPQTNIDILKDTWTITPHIVNQFSVAYGRYKSYSWSPNDAPQYAASKTGLLNLPAGQAQYFPGISFASGGTGNPTNEANYDWNQKVNNTYAIEDNLVWQRGKHNFTLGGQVVEAQFNYIKNVNYSSPMGYTFSYAQSAGYTSSGGIASSTGSSWASYMLGAVSSSSISVGVPELATRWLDPSFWAQDDYKLNSKLTINAGLRWDLWPAIHEAHDYISWLNPTGANTVTGNLGTLAFAGGNSSDGYHTGQHIPSPLWWKNLAPRVGLAYQLDNKTVVRTSYGLAFARGDWTSGSQSGSPSTTGLVPSASAASAPSNQPQFYWDGTACTTTAGGTGTYAGDGFTPCGWTGSVAAPSTMLPSGATMAEYATVETAAQQASNPYTATVYSWDKNRGARTPEYENWSVGIERQITNDMSISVSYVGSEGHFLNIGSAMWQTNNKLPESYAGLSAYTLTASNGSTQAACSGASCVYPVIGQKATPAYLAMAVADGYTPSNPYTGGAVYYASNSVSGYYTPFPQFSGVSDTTSFVGNENWNALEMVLKQRPSHGLNWMLSYTYSKSIDDLGTFRVYDNTRLDRSISAASQPQNLTVTAVYKLPFGKGHRFGENLIYRSALSDWSLSGIGTYRSGMPIIVQASGCAGSSILSTCMPNLVPGQLGRQYQYGKTAGGSKANWDPSSPNYIGKVQYVNPAAFTVTNSTCTDSKGKNLYHTYSAQAYYVCGGPEAYVPGNAPRVAPLHMFGQSKANVDMSLKRSFAIYHEWKADFDIDMSNVFNHVIYYQPGLSGTTPYSNTTVQAGSNSSFGSITGVQNYPRQAQASLRINW